MAQCATDRLVFQDAGRRQVTGRFNGGRLTSDAGATLLREANRVLGVTERIAQCFVDHRDQARTEHSVQDLVAQRVMALALGYEDLTDHDRLRTDSTLALAVGRKDLTGQQRARVRDRAYPLAGSSTLNRMELGCAETAREDRYKKIVADADAIDELLVDLFLDMHPDGLGEIVLDADATDIKVHGKQEGGQFNGYYDHYCYLPLYITCGDHVLSVRLRPSRIDAPEGSVEELERVVAQIRARWPEVKITVRGDAGFCRDQIMRWCEDNGIWYVFGLSRNPRLQRKIRRQMSKAGSRCVMLGKASRRFRDFRYRTLAGWSCKRRVVAKAEWLPGPRGYNSRFVVTNIPKVTIRARPLYEDLYCARGEMENRIREQQLDLFADRTSATTMRTNQLRACFSAFAGVLMQIIRQFGLQSTSMARAQAGTIRTRLLKIAGSIKVTTRNIWVSFSTLYPLRELFQRIVRKLATAAQRLRPVPA